LFTLQSSIALACHAFPHGRVMKSNPIFPPHFAVFRLELLKPEKASIRPINPNLPPAKNEA
jgi:hypothetical protein